MRIVVVVLAIVICLGAVQVIFIPLHLLMFFLAAMLCHGELALGRPSVRHLTEFYLAISVGGVLGGVFNALVAPVVFDRIVEYPLAIALACLALPIGAPAMPPPATGNQRAHVGLRPPIGPRSHHLRGSAAAW